MYEKYKFMDTLAIIRFVNHISESYILYLNDMDLCRNYYYKLLLQNIQKITLMKKFSYF